MHNNLTQVNLKEQNKLLKSFEENSHVQENYLNENFGVETYKNTITNSPIQINKNVDHDSEKHIKFFIKNVQSIDFKNENVNKNSEDILSSHKNEITFES